MLKYIIMPVKFIPTAPILTAIFTLILIFLFSTHIIAFAQMPSGQKDASIQKFYKAKILKVLRRGEHKIQEFNNPYQTLSVEIIDGPNAGKKIIFTQGLDSSIQPQNLVKAGDSVVLTITSAGPGGKPQYIIYDKYRISNLIIISIIFLIIVLIIAGLRGVGSLLGLAISLAVILLYIIPQIISGQSPLLVSILGSLIILVVTTYLAHGVSRQTTVALISTFISLMVTIFISNYFVNFTGLTGLNDETSMLIFGSTSNINLQGLLLAGVIIGTLGALNDITTSQSATVFELSRTDTRLKFAKLFSKGMVVGREHILSMVNTLVLAYAGSSLILFIFIVLNPARVPPWVIINSELISDEIVRTISGSIGLLLVVPIVTAIATMVCDKKFKSLLA